MSSTEPNDTDLSFEESIRRLSQIVEELEAGELPLEKSVELFETGMRLARRSQRQLDHAEKRVEELLSVEHDGTPITRALDGSDDG
jgi:exodeoxyribonuclease VII small subunit